MIRNCSDARTMKSRYAVSAVLCGSTLLGLQQGAASTALALLLHAAYSTVDNGRDRTAVGLSIGAALAVELGAASVEVVDEVLAPRLVEARLLQARLDRACAWIAWVRVFAIQLLLG